MFTLPPLLILLLGVTVVISMILVLRVNAFIALITAACLVSLLSPGEFGHKIERVAEAFGAVAGSIGIVIALAAIIGVCLLESGAADRIVRTFLRLLGEKGTPVALMGSGFVLSIPVFFDTVFYLLMPLARSMYRRTHKNYMLYVLALAAGGAVTHTLVPPTPGPLFMANELQIDLGVMILAGVLVGVPSATAGMILGGLIDRKMDVPMRPYTGEPEPEPPEESALPSFWLSVLPVALPVVLISANTVVQALADAEHTAQLRPSQVEDWAAFSAALSSETDSADTTPMATLFEQLPPDVRQSIQVATESGECSAMQQQAICDGINGLLVGRELFRSNHHQIVDLPEDSRKAIDAGLAKIALARVEHHNRVALECALDGELAPHIWSTPRRKCSRVTAALGNPNLALLLSAGIAMAMLARFRKLSLRKLGATTERALLSGGVIILITAAGGAFGRMLREAGIDKMVEGTLGNGEGFGLWILPIAFGAASVIKIAQGSGTVAMITASTIFAGLGCTAETLGFHPAYLALAIGGGSMVCSWMNDSGFWVFSRMAVLTETETLKSCTVVIAFCGFVSLGLTCLLAWALPMAGA